MKQIRQTLARALHDLGLPASEGAVDKLLSYISDLSQWTRKVDLVSSDNPEIILEHHVLDCLGAYRVWLERQSRYGWGRVVDVGSGAGLPGVVWSILAEQEFLLVEPRARRAAFLREMIRRLKLRHTSVAEMRLEGVSRETLSSGLWCLVSRGLTPSDVVTPSIHALMHQESVAYYRLGTGRTPTSVPKLAAELFPYTVCRGNASVERALEEWVVFRSA